MEPDVGAGNPSARPKRHSPNPIATYFMNVDIRTCVDVIESGMTYNTPTIHAEVLEGWMTRFVKLLLCFAFNQPPLVGTLTSTQRKSIPNHTHSSILQSFGNTLLSKMQKSTRTGKPSLQNWENRRWLCHMAVCQSRSIMIGRTRSGRSSNSPNERFWPP